MVEGANGDRGRCVKVELRKVVHSSGLILEPRYFMDGKGRIGEIDEGPSVGGEREWG
jgi:hypothetical protein